MENRLIFVTAEQARSLEHVQSSELENLGVDMQNAAKQLSEMGNIRARPGGSVVADRLKKIGDHPDTPNVGKTNIEQLLTERKAAADVREKNINPQTTARLDAANGKIENALKKAEERIKERAILISKFERLATFGDADKIFANVQILAKGETKDFEWKQGGLSANLEGFKKLGIPKGKTFLAEMEKAQLATPDGTDALLAKFANDPRLSKHRRDYAKNPEKYGDTKKHALEWFRGAAEVDKNILHRETAFAFLESKQPLLAKSGERMPSKNEIFEKSTGEFNQYFEGLKQKIAKVDTEAAAQIDKMKVSEGAEIKTAQVEMKTSGEEKEKAESDKFGELARKIKDSSVRKDLMRELDAKKKEAKKDKSSDTQNRMAEVRGSKEQPSLFKRMLSKFGGRKQEEEGKEDDAETHEQASKAVVDDLIGTESEATDRDENLKLSNSQRKQIAEMFDFKELPKGREWENPLAILMLKDVDAKSVEDATKKNREWWRGKTEMFG
ncbi:MAG: hypothetical protein ABIE14_04435 [Patescibacteria group bacterium]